jgi:hypothetical protein
MITPNTSRDFMSRTFLNSNDSTAQSDVLSSILGILNHFRNLWEALLRPHFVAGSGTTSFSAEIPSKAPFFVPSRGQ